MGLCSLANSLKNVPRETYRDALLFLVLIHVTILHRFEPMSRVAFIPHPGTGQDFPLPLLIAFCAERLADYKKPRSVDFVDELPRNPAGKLLKNKIRELYWAGTGRRI
jgi:hypothetical protein